MPNLFSRLRQFFSDTRATITVEFVIILPILIWAYGGIYVFWDAYKSQNISVKAAYTISDLISRADYEITETNLSRIHQMVSFLNYDKHPVRVRISFVDMEDDGAGNPELVLEGSRVRGPDPVAPFDALQEEPFTRHTSIASLEPIIPVMAINDRAIVVETELDYTPLFQFVGYPFPPRILSYAVVTRPRSGGRIGFADPAPSG